MSACRITRDPQARELTIERVVNASRALAWAGWTEPRQVEQWWGPREWTTTVYRMEVRPGGVWHYCMRAVFAGESREVWGRAVYTEVREPSRLAYSEAFSDAAGNVVDGRERSTSVDFEEDGPERTRIVIRTRFATLEEMEAAENMGMVKGYEMTLERLDACLR